MMAFRSFFKTISSVILSLSLSLVYLTASEVNSYQEKLNKSVNGIYAFFNVYSVYGITYNLSNLQTVLENFYQDKESSSTTNKDSITTEEYGFNDIITLCIQSINSTENFNDLEKALNQIKTLINAIPQNNNELSNFCNKTISPQLIKIQTALINKKRSLNSNFWFETVGKSVVIASFFVAFALMCRALNEANTFMEDQMQDIAELARLIKTVQSGQNSTMFNTTRPIDLSLVPVKV